MDNMPLPSDLWLPPNDWRKYEQYIFGLLQQRFPRARLTPDARIVGIKSGRSRQIDVFVEVEIGKCAVKIAFDCKCYGRRVNIKDVEGFLGMLDDLRVSKGVMVTTKGYTKAALERAKREARDIDLQILPPERLSHYQFIGCLWTWRAPVAAFVEPPDGWVVDFEDQTGPMLFSMYPLGHTRASAASLCPFIYGNIILKTDTMPTMESIASHHEQRVLEKISTAVFERIRTSAKGAPLPQRCLLRVGDVHPSYGGPEYSLYVDCPLGVLLVVLLCPKGRDHVFLPALEWVGLGAVVMHRAPGANPPLPPGQHGIVGCTLFPRGARQKLVESPDRTLEVVE